MIRNIVLAIVVAAVTAGGTAVANDVADDAVPFARQGYAGLSFRDLPGGHVIISWIFPGPLQGEGIAAPAVDLGRPDLVVALNGSRPTGAAAARAAIRTMAPGDTLRLEFRKSNARGGAIPDTLDHAPEVRTLEIPLASRERWSGTLGVTRGHTTQVEWEPMQMLNPDDPGNMLGAALREHNLLDPVTLLRGVFHEWEAKAPDFHALSRVRAGFDDPFRLPELARAVTRPAAEARAFPIDTVFHLLSENLDATPTGLSKSAVAGASSKSAAVQAWRLVDERSRRALSGVNGDASFVARALSLLRVPHDTFYLAGEETLGHTEVIRASMRVDFSELVGAVASLKDVARADWSRLQLEKPTHEPRMGVAEPPADAAVPRATVAPPETLRGAVEGPIHAAFQDEDGHWFVEGSSESNRYDLSKIALIVDPGGDDEYYATDLVLGTRIVVDMAGNDKYTGTEDQGPASAILGVTLVDDRAGDDHYEGSLLSAGAALFGVAILLDRGGSDAYIGSQWSIGAAVYGGGIVLDLGGGSDAYLGDFLCQGVGGPRGLGAIIDEAGRDLYRANGPTPSAYGTPGVFQSFSQGIGFGFRNYAAGGIGMICDLAGDDRYEAGEFAQGGAYYHALGVLHDHGGRDLYYGNRYGQGFGVHQAMGALVDEEGDDTYWSMTAASQGGAWDVGAGLLLDMSGNDAYQCDGLGQGGAAQQAIAMLVDLDGADRYVAKTRSTQGESGGNTYHYGETSAYSLSVLLDLGGDEDDYSGDRGNNTSLSPGEADTASPASSRLHGLFVDR